MSELRYKRIEGKFLVSQLADEMVLMDTVTGDYMGLNPVGATIWSMLETQQTLASLVSELLIRYEVSEAQCRPELESFLLELNKRKMLTLE